MATATAAAAAADERPYATRRAARVAKLRASAAGAALGGLPADVLELVGERLFSLEQEDKLNCLATWARDVVNIALSCKALYGLARTRLWAKLGEVYAPAASPFYVTGGFTNRSYEQLLGLPGPKASYVRDVGSLRSMPGDNMWFDCRFPADGVPRHVFSEVVRLRCRGVAASVAKKLFLLSDGDLAQLRSKERKRGTTMKASRLFALPDLIAAARAKHGTEAGLEAAKRARQAAADKHRQAKAKAVSARRDALREALAAHGVQLTAELEDLELVRRHVSGGNAATGPAPRLDDVLPLARLAAWCAAHTRYTAMRRSVLRSAQRRVDLREAIKEKLAGKWGDWDDYDDDGPLLFGSYLAYSVYGLRPDLDGMVCKAAKKLSPDEEDDLLRLALREWADKLGGGGGGGDKAALADAAVPKRGVVRASIKEALKEPLEADVKEYVDSAACSDSDDDDDDNDGGRCPGCGGFHGGSEDY